MSSRQLTINRTDFDSAFGWYDPETDVYLDTQTGENIYVEEHARSFLEVFLYGRDDEVHTLDDLLAVYHDHPDRFDVSEMDFMDAARVEWDTEDRYQPLPEQNSYEGYRDMQDYIWSLEDDHLRELLQVAIQGRGAFRRFKDVLRGYPDGREAWFVLSHPRKQKRMMDWFNAIRIDPVFE